jgi:hypothetical protein
MHGDAYTGSVSRDRSFLVVLDVATRGSVDAGGLKPGPRRLPSPIRGTA